MAAEPNGVVGPPAGWPEGVGAVTTTREVSGLNVAGRFGWNLAAHVDDDPGAVTASRQHLLTLTGVRTVQWLNQVHGSRSIEATSATAVAGSPEADAAWTREPGVAVAVLTADCVPVVVCDRAGTVAGVAHGGWRGLAGGVLEGLLRSLPVAPTELVAWLGPAIGPDAFEVGDDVVSAVAALEDGAGLLTGCRRPGRPGKHYLDLFTLSERLLRRRGVPTVHCERLCTWRQAERFFSYRREGVTGRMATLAWVRED